jgi:hypothetical protein
LEAHGGYLCRIEGFGDLDLAALAREALGLDGERAEGCALQLSGIPKRKVVRLAFDAPFTYGPKGAGWYEAHHAMARLLSERAQVTVHAYLIEPDRREQVVAYGAGRKVGGEALDYADVDVDDELDDIAFAQLASRWPLGHLAYVYGVPREMLLRLPRSQSVLIELARGNADLRELWSEGSPFAAA